MSRVTVEWHGDEAIARADAAIARGINRGLDMIAETSQDRVLVQSGELKASQNQSQDGNSGTVYYTDSKAVGAHENLTVTPKRGKRAKFLESALHDRAADAVDAIRDEVRKAL